MLVNPSQAARTKGVSRCTIYKWMRKGVIIPVQRLERQILIDADELDEIVIKRKHKKLCCPNCNFTGKINEFNKL